MMPISTPIIGALAIAGFFTGSVTMIAISRVSAWKKMSDAQFREDFAATLRAADKLQPAMLVLALALTIWSATALHGTAQLLTTAAILAQAAPLIGSGAVLVPLQNRIMAGGTVDPETLHKMRERWCAGNTGRAVLSVVMLLLVTAAAITASA